MSCRIILLMLRFQDTFITALPSAALLSRTTAVSTSGAAVYSCPYTHFPLKVQDDTAARGKGTIIPNQRRINSQCQQSGQRSLVPAAGSDRNAATCTAALLFRQRHTRKLRPFKFTDLQAVRLMAALQNQLYRIRRSRSVDL